MSIYVDPLVIGANLKVGKSLWDTHIISITYHKYKSKTNHTTIIYHILAIGISYHKHISYHMYAKSPSFSKSTPSPFSRLTYDILSSFTS